MVNVELTHCGLKITLSGDVSVEQARTLYLDAERLLGGDKITLGVVVDMRSLIPLEKDAQDELVITQMKLRELGNDVRSAVVLNSPVITMQFRALAGQSKILDIERYIDASKEENWEKIAIDWVVKGKEPIENSRLVMEN